jgi:hypothetical protein
MVIALVVLPARPNTTTMELPVQKLQHLHRVNSQNHRRVEECDEESSAVRSAHKIVHTTRSEQ